MLAAGATAVASIAGATAEASIAGASMQKQDSPTSSVPGVPIALRTVQENLIFKGLLVSCTFVHMFFKID